MICFVIIAGVEDSVIMEYLRLADLMKLYHRIGGLDIVADWNWLEAVFVVLYQDMTQINFNNLDAFYDAVEHVFMRI